MDTLVFVYGSLKKEYHNHLLLEKSKYLGQYSTNPEFSMYDLGDFPAITLMGNTKIYGEVYLVDEETFKRLDKLEGYPRFYNRKVIDVYPVDGSESTKAWVYFINPEDINLEEDYRIDTGIW